MYYARYCTCGAAFQLHTNSPKTAETLMAEWLRFHTGKGHLETDARTAWRARQKADAVHPPAPQEKENA